jgi:hypothetical protein
MDQKLLEQTISQLAEVVIMPRDSALTTGRTQYAQTNGHVGVIIQKLRPRPATCQDCSQQLESSPNRSFSWRNNQWREHCSGCNRFRDPKTGQFPEVKSKVGLDSNQSQPTEHQSKPTEPETIWCFHEQVIEREYRGSLIQEFVRTPVEILLHPIDARD